MPFREAWVVIGAFLILVGFGAAEPAVTGVGVAIVVIGGVSRLWSQHAFDRVSFRTALSERRVFPGEPVQLDVAMENRKLLPLPWYTWRLALADSLRVNGDRLASAAVPGSSWLVRRGALGWYERQRWSFTLDSSERGYHHIGPATLRSADLFGLLPTAKETPETLHIVVYPHASRLEELGIPADRPIGSFRGRNRIFEDPIRISGLRDYRPGDPLKRIDWKATARRGELQSRVYEPSAEPQLYILVNIDTLEHSWEGYLKEDLERTISVAASIALWAGQHRYSVGLLANGSFPEADRPIRLAPSRSRDQITRVLEALAVIQPLTMGDLAQAVHRESGRVPAGSTIVLVAAFIPEPLAAAILRLHDERNHVVVIPTSQRADTRLLADLPVYPVPGVFSAPAQPWGPPA